MSLDGEQILQLMHTQGGYWSQHQGGDAEVMFDLFQHDALLSFMSGSFFAHLGFDFSALHHNNRSFKHICNSSDPDQPYPPLLVT